jgi:short-subunit dehydrogenase
MRHDIQNVLITGAGSGIGQALAVEASKRGMAVALVGRRQEASEATAKKLSGLVPVLVLAADVTRPEERRRLALRVDQAWGSLNTLVNNAGVVEAGPVSEIDDDALERVFATNAIAPMALAREFLPLLRSRKPARVVNVGSVFGDIPYPGFAAYSASKFAMRGFSIALRREWATLGIGVTYAAPRATRTAAAAAFGPLIEAAKMTLDEPDRVARLIWDAVERGDHSVYPRGPERVFVLAQRLFPRLVDRALAKQAAALA